MFSEWKQAYLNTKFWYEPWEEFLKQRNTFLWKRNFWYQMKMLYYNSPKSYWKSDPVMLCRSSKLGKWSLANVILLAYICEILEISKLLPETVTTTSLTEKFQTCPTSFTFLLSSIHSSILKTLRNRNLLK